MCSREQEAKHMREVLKMNKDCIKKMYPSIMIKEYIDTDLAYAERKQKISSIYGVCCKDNTTKTKINKRFGIAKRGNSK